MGIQNQAYRWIYDGDMKFVGKISNGSGFDTSEQLDPNSYPTCQDVINYMNANNGIVDTNYQNQCTTISGNTFFTNLEPIVTPVPNQYSLALVSYGKIQEAEYKVLNDGTLDVSSDGGIDPNSPNSGPDINFGKIKIPSEIRLYEAAYFDNLMDTEIHELLPTPPASWPKEPPVLRQVWPHKAGPGNWPSGPTIVNKDREKTDVWTRTDYYNNIFSNGSPNSWDAPNPSIISSWGDITSNKWYPYPPGVLVYGCTNYITDANVGTIQGSGTSTPGIQGKYCIIKDDNPLFVADAYNFKTDDGVAMPEEVYKYGPNSEVEDGLEYEWIVDGKVVSNKKYYQIWGVNSPNGNKGAVHNEKNDSFSGQAINVVLIVKNKVGSVSTNFSFVVWGGLDTKGAPLDWGRDWNTGIWDHPDISQQNNVGFVTTLNDKVQNYFWGTPFKSFKTVNNGLHAIQSSTFLGGHSSPPGAPGLPAPWGSYYSWNEDLGVDGEVILIQGGIPNVPTWDDFPQLPPIIFFSANKNEVVHTSTANETWKVPVGLTVPPNDTSLWITGYDQGGSWIDGGWFNYLDNMQPENLITPGIKLPNSLRKNNGGPYGSGDNLNISQFKDYWKERVWSYRGFPSGQESVDTNNLDKIDLDNTETGLKYSHNQIWIRPPSEVELTAGCNQVTLKIFFELARADWMITQALKDAWELIKDNVQSESDYDMRFTLTLKVSHPSNQEFEILGNPRTFVQKPWGHVPKLAKDGGGWVTYESGNYIGQDGYLLFDMQDITVPEIPITNKIQMAATPLTSWSPTSYGFKVT